MPANSSMVRRATLSAKGEGPAPGQRVLSGNGTRRGLFPSMPLEPAALLWAPGKAPRPAAPFPAPAEGRLRHWPGPGVAYSSHLSGRRNGASTWGRYVWRPTDNGRQPSRDHWAGRHLGKRPALLDRRLRRSAGQVSGDLWAPRDGCLSGSSEGLQPGRCSASQTGHRPQQRGAKPVADRLHRLDSWPSRRIDELVRIRRPDASFAPRIGERSATPAARRQPALVAGPRSASRP
jgi:hypothetical protein